jgi:hypothetical protein
MFRKIEFNKKTPPKKKKRKPIPQQEDLRDHYGGRDGVSSLYDVKLRNVQDIPRVNDTDTSVANRTPITADDSQGVTSFGDDAQKLQTDNQAANKPFKVQVDGPVQWHQDMSPIKKVAVPADQLAKGKAKCASAKANECPRIKDDEWHKDEKPKDKQKEGGRLLPQRVPSRRVAPLPTVKDEDGDIANTASEPMPDYSEASFDIKSSHKEFSAIIQEKYFDDIELSMICMDSDDPGNETEGERWSVRRHLSNLSNLSKYLVRRRESGIHTDGGISPKKDNPCEARENGSLLELFQTYFEAIIRDDADYVDATIEKIPKGSLECILNGNFEFEHPTLLFTKAANEVNQDFFIRQMNVKRPLSLAALFKSKNVFNILIDRGSNPFMPDTNHNNILHILIFGSFYQPQSEKDYIQIYHLLISRIQHDVQRRYLLHSENLDTLRPIEMALKLKRFTFFREILYTSGVDRTVAGGSGAINCSVFDMSSYAAIGERQNRSPLYLLFDTTEEEFQGLAESHLLQDPVIRAWMEAIWCRNLPYLIAWVILFRLLYLLVFISFDIKCYSLFVEYLSLNRTMNDTSDTEEQLKVDKNTMRIGFLFLFIISLISILFDLVSLVYFLISRWKLRSQNLPPWLQPEGHGYIHKMFLFYRIHYITLAIITVLHSSIEFNDLTGTDPDIQTFGSILLILKYLLALVAITYFLMVIPVIDIFMIGLQRVIYMVYIFILLYAPLYLIFLAMMHYVLAYHCSVKARLHKDFNTDMYLIRASSDQLAHCSTAGIALSVLVQYLHLFIFCILFINHLVTYICTDFLRFAKYKSVVVSLVRIHMAVVIENRIGRHRYHVSKTEPINICEFCNDHRIKHVCVAGMSL